MNPRRNDFEIDRSPSFVWRPVALRTWVLQIVIAGLFFSCSSLAYAETTQTLEDFLALRPRWPSLVGTTLQIEGRYSILSPTQMRMAKCDLEFVLARDFPDPAGDSKTILIKGRLEKRDEKLVFVVSDLQPLQSDTEHFRSLRGKVPPNKPDEWYKLATWGERRATFYKDDDLKKEAIEAFRQGVLSEHRTLNPVTPAGLRALAAKLATKNVAPPLQQEYLHEALRLDFNTILKDNRGGDGELLTLIAKQLPGTDQPLKEEDAVLREAYSKSPLVAFKDGDAAQRQKIARAFYIEVMKYRILKDASPDGKNGYAIATRIEEQLPEFQSLVPEYREKELDYHLGRVGAMTRKEMLELVSRFEQLNATEFVVKLKRKWVTEKEKQIDASSAVALVDLADDFMIILGDKESAIRFYKKAYAKSPGTQVIADWLTEQGLTLHGGEWIPKGEVPAAPADPLAAAIREGQVQKGMTAEQVKSALGVDPTERTRIATSGHIQEWWVFADHGLSVEFTRRRRTEAAIVSRVMNVNVKPRAAQEEPAKPKGSEGF